MDFKKLVLLNMPLLSLSLKNKAVIKIVNICDFFLHIHTLWPKPAFGVFILHCLPLTESGFTLAGTYPEEFCYLSSGIESQILIPN